MNLISRNTPSCRASGLYRGNPVQRKAANYSKELARRMEDELAESLRSQMGKPKVEAESTTGKLDPETAAKRKAAGQVRVEGTRKKILGILHRKNMWMSTSDIGELAGLSTNYAYVQVAALVDAGLVDRMGSNRATRYRVAK